eukprot:TRINITY_DN36068_c0_g1_i1.p1 TRINITY_DN36068_c0_g1~~TRINITY_DN36068_c0_g1_i1.p1  ORF type:complete len:221 (-),score=35.26 TRINITY_DN36068_c0_g1_i1:31-693(-)
MGIAFSLEKANDDFRKGGTKQVYLVRHAESLANVSSYNLRQCRCNKALAACVEAGSSICCDPPLSEIGQMQVEEISAQLESDRFVEVAGVQLVAHSEYSRARATCEGMFGSSGVPIVELGILNEWHVTDIDCSLAPGTNCSRAFEARVEQTKKWLALRPEHVICLVAHGIFFERLQEESGGENLYNGEIRRCTFDLASLTMDVGVTLYCPSDFSSDECLE